MLLKQSALKERVVLAIDSRQNYQTQALMKLAKCHGAQVVKFGVEVATIYSWGYCADVAQEYDLKWIADTKLHDSPRSSAQTTSNFANMSYPPFGLTIHASSGYESLRAAQDSAGVVKMLGLTVLSSLSRAEVISMYGKNTDEIVQQFAQNIASIGMAGIVCSPDMVAKLKSNDTTADLVVMTEGARMRVGVFNDQQGQLTPKQALLDGADMLVAGREITAADMPGVAYAELVNSLD